MNSLLKANSAGWLVAVLLLAGCGDHSTHPANPTSSNGRSNAVSSSAIAVTSEYLIALRKRGSELFAANSAVIYKTHDRLSKDSPLRSLLRIPPEQEIFASYLQRVNNVTSEYELRLQDKNRSALFGIITVDERTKQVANVYDSKALGVIQEIENRVRVLAGTRDEAMRLFSRGSSISQMDRERAVNSLAEALMLKPDVKLHVEMTAPGGSNGGTGYLRAAVNDEPYEIALIVYQRRDTVGSFLGFTSPTFNLRSVGWSKFGAIRLESGWTNWNSRGLLLDLNGCPFTPTREAK